MKHVIYCISKLLGVIRYILVVGEPGSDPGATGGDPEPDHAHLDSHTAQSLARKHLCAKQFAPYVVTKKILE